MPVYEFVCSKCGNKEEQLVKIGKDKIKCSECGGASYKVMSASSFILKGKNWYKDHYGLKKGKKESK